MLEEIKELFLKRGITVQENLEEHKRDLRKSFLAAFIFSIIYGAYEYFIVYNYPNLLGLYGGNPIINWGLMYSALILTVAIAPRFSWYKTLTIILVYSCTYILAGIYFQILLIPILLACVITTFLFIVSIEQTVMGLLLMTVLEDLVFFMSSWIDTGIYPYPACTIGVPESCWWNTSLATFRILGNLGNPIPFWPYIPFYYIPGFIMIVAYYLLAYKRAIYGRAYSWIFGSFFLAIIGGALINSDYIAMMILIFFPLALLGYVFLITIREYYHLKEKKEALG
ncbi:MAG: hypothetical protein ACTSQI_19125 [Candidatus Helarchaeota archaeon]